MNAEIYRELPAGGRGHGLVHVALHVPKVPRPPATLCGIPKHRLRKQGAPFRGWTHVLCPRCSVAMDRIAEASEEAANSLVTG